MRAIDADSLLYNLEGTMAVSPTGYIHGDTIVDMIGDAPTIEPERKTGKWIPVTNGRGGFECDQCHNYAPSYQDGVEWLSGFCPNCGAEMRTSVDTAKDIVHEAIDNSVWSDIVDTAKLHNVVDDKNAEIRGDVNVDAES